MNQHTPPHNPEDPGRDPYGSDAPSFAQEQGAGANPYYANARANPQPDLDAGSPVLTSAEAQRLNRKALFFLGGIVVLLLLLGYFVLWGGSDEEDEPQQRSQASQVDVPRAPTTMPDLPADQNDAAMVEQNIEPLPVLPPQEPADAGSSSGGRDSYEPSGPRAPTLMERRMGAAGGVPGEEGGSAPGSASGGEAQAAEMQLRQMQAMQNAMLGLPPGGVAAPTVAMAATNAQFLSNPQALLVRGTYLRCVLETRIITDIPGYTSCILTEPVYSVNGRQMLLPKGSKLLGRYQEQDDGISRVAVVWDRIVTPTGMDVTMSSPGVDGLGGAGHPGDLNNHWAQKITSALLISLIADAFSYAAAENGPETSVFTPGGTVVQQPFQSATARSMERLANEALRKSAARPSTVTINQGTVVNVYVAQDVDFSSVMASR